MENRFNQCGWSLKADLDQSLCLVNNETMRQIQASEAKSRFLQLLDEVEQGETIVITRHGKPVRA